MESSWTSLLTTHFNATKAHPVSSFDPSGFVIIASALLLLVGVVVGSVRWLFSSDGRLLRDQMEKNLQEMQDYVDEQRKQVEENLESFKEQAGRQGFIAEMLSFAYLSRLAFSIVAMVITAYLNALAAVVAGWRTPNVIILTLTKEDSGEKTLPDLGHDFFKYVATRIYGSFVIKYFHLPDQFLAAVAAVVVIMLFFHPRRLLILRRICSIFACVNLMRAICVAATSLPDASPMCIAQFESEDGLYKATPIFPKAFARAFKVLLRPSEHITCGDMVFSGHTVFFMLCAMTVKWYCVRSELDTSFTRRYPQVLWMVRYTVYSGVGLGIFMIIGTRLHYTLDVLIAIYVTTQVWFMYHWLLSNPRKSMRVLNWLEHDEVRFIDSDAYRQARRSFRLKKNALLPGAKTE